MKTCLDSSTKRVLRKDATKAKYGTRRPLMSELLSPHADDLPVYPTRRTQSPMIDEKAEAIIFDIWTGDRLNYFSPLGVYHAG